MFAYLRASTPAWELRVVVCDKRSSSGVWRSIWRSEKWPSIFAINIYKHAALGAAQPKQQRRNDNFMAARSLRNTICQHQWLSIDAEINISWRLGIEVWQTDMSTRALQTFIWCRPAPARRRYYLYCPTFHRKSRFSTIWAARIFTLRGIRLFLCADVRLAWRHPLRCALESNQAGNLLNWPQSARWQASWIAIDPACP